MEPIYLQFFQIFIEKLTLDKFHVNDKIKPALAFPNISRHIYKFSIKHLKNLNGLSSFEDKRERSEKEGLQRGRINIF